MDLGLKDKIALVTGASRGLGYATALELAREGAKVAINSRSPEKVEAAAAQIRAETGALVAALPGDVTAPETPERLVQAVVEAFGGLDVPRAPGARRAALLAALHGGQRTDHYFLFRQAAGRQFTALQQHPRRHGWHDQKPGVGNGPRRHPV